MAPSPSVSPPEPEPDQGQESAPAAKPRSRRPPKGPSAGTATAKDQAAANLSFAEAQTALELCLAQLQATDLAVEAMAELYQRALTYADRCETVLQAVENEVMLWDPSQPDQPPKPLSA